MNLAELVRLKALEAKRFNHGGGDVQDQLIDDFMKRDGGEFRNICAHISPQLFEEIESICSQLSISKRRFVEGALIEALKNATVIISEVQPFDLEG